MKLKSFFGSMLICAISIASCCEEEKTEAPLVHPEEVASDSAGIFIVVNTRTNDTLTVNGNPKNNSVESLIARIGDTLKIAFNPKEEFKDYSFKASYNFPNNNVKEGDLEYNYIVKDLKEERYDIDLEAKSSGTNIANDTIWNLTAKGKFYLKIIVPYANIDYELSCPSVLLEYATPQITYIGNDGTPVKFTIPESDWEEGVVYAPQTTIIVIDGDTVVSESMKRMQWTKRVEYEDFSVVDDEMTVVYIPKDNIPMGNVDKIEGLKPGLSAHLEFVDDNGRYYKPIFMDMDMDINIGTPGSRSLSEIISDHHNYKGFHVESNGTYDTK